MRVPAKRGDAEVAAGELPGLVLDEEVELGSEGPEVWGRRAKEAAEGVVQRAEMAVVEVVVFGVGDLLESGFGAPVAGEGSRPEAIGCRRR
jgi:hypothetical protein